MHRTLTALLVVSCLVPGCANEIPPLPLTDTRPITGGTLAITADGVAVAADTDRDLVSVVDLDTREARQIKLTAGDEPGRVVIDAAGRAHVVLRRAGAVARIDTRSAEIVDRRQVCPAPRGIAYDAAREVVHVACAGGELVTLPAAGGPPIRNVRLDRDLRDVVVQGDTLLVSRFRSAELLAVSAAGNVVQRRSPLPTSSSLDEVTSRPSVAWRTLALPTGEIAMVHQRATSTQVGTDSGAYGWGSACSEAIVGSTVTFFEADGNLGSDLPMPGLGFDTVLAVDIAADEGGNLGVVAAGSRQVRFIGTRGQLETTATTDGCSFFFEDEGADQNVVLDVTPTAIATWRGRWFVQARERPEIIEVGVGAVASTIDLEGHVIDNAGDALFHASWNGVACAGCHPEGGDDGQVWLFEGIGARRTQNLTGGLMHRAPFHWRGELPDLDALVNEVLVDRMEGTGIGGPMVPLLGRWLDALPAIPPSPAGTPEQIRAREAALPRSARRLRGLPRREVLHQQRAPGRRHGEHHEGVEPRRRLRPRPVLPRRLRLDARGALRSEQGILQRRRPARAHLPACAGGHPRPDRVPRDPVAIDNQRSRRARPWTSGGSSHQPWWP
ncbi:MAG: cytochrome-c peroxidase [Minicystis sp.]